jgi:signal transduction histidine kinase
LAGNNNICDGCKYQNVITDKKVQKMNYINYITGRKGHYEVILSPLIDEEGNVVAVVDLIIDVTENINMQQKMLQSEKLSALGLLAGGIAHEINNPLVGILNFAQLLSKKIDNKSPEGKLVDTIIEAGTETKRIVQNLLVYARQSVDKKETYPIEESIEFAIKILNSKIRAKCLKVNILQEETFIVRANKGKIHQVFLNLLTNSIDASKNNGRIDIVLNFNKKEIKIKDYGIGIKKEFLDKIFDPFFTTKDVGEGTGLGLSIIAGIINEHGWNISVESEFGKYTVFTIKMELN